MTYYNLFCFAKLYAVATGLDKQSSLSKAEIDAASEALKAIADSCNNLTQEQKDWYKMIILCNPCFDSRKILHFGIYE